MGEFVIAGQFGTDDLSGGVIETGKHQKPIRRTPSGPLERDLLVSPGTINRAHGCV